MDERFSIDDNASAMWVADKLAAAKDKLEQDKNEAEEIRDLRIKQAKEYYDKYLSETQNEIEYFQGLLVEYAYQNDGVIDLPNIRVKIGQAKKFDYPKDKTKLLEIAKKYAPDTVQTEEKASWTDLKNKFKFTDDGKAISEDGEIVDGISQRFEEKTNIKIRNAE